MKLKFEFNQCMLRIFRNVFFRNENKKKLCGKFRCGKKSEQIASLAFKSKINPTFFRKGFFPQRKSFAEIFFAENFHCGK